MTRSTNDSTGPYISTQTLILEWNGLPQKLIATLIRIMPSPCRCVINEGLFDPNNAQYKSLRLLMEFSFNCS